MRDVLTRMMYLRQKLGLHVRVMLSKRRVKKALRRVSVDPGRPTAVFGYVVDNLHVVYRFHLLLVYCLVLRSVCSVRYLLYAVFL